MTTDKEIFVQLIQEHKKIILRFVILIVPMKVTGRIWHRKLYSTYGSHLEASRPITNFPPGCTVSL